ncbi:hypothetical protein ACFVMC_00200 [Nocardia sp. NPDC127579]|uniref:hypothetical protein n=1 Tax=Nocardia sp. NPDC127579 TaxID=3345402 RepID=UPI00362EDDEA
MGLPLLAAVAAALFESSKSGPPDVGKDESPDATAARTRISEILAANALDFQGSKVPADTYKEPDGMDDLYERVQAMDPGTVTTMHQRWETFRNELNEGFVSFGLEMTKLIEAKWQGEAANSAATGITEYVKNSNTLVESAALMTAKVKLVKSAVDITKPAVQQAPEPSWTSNIASWVPGPTWKLNQHRDETYDTAAVNAVKNVFYPAVKEADDKVPLAPTPANPVQPNNTDDSSKPKSIVPGTPKPADDPVTPSNTDDPKTGDQPEEPTTGDPNQSPEDTNPASTNPASTAAPTTPSSVDPSKTTDPKLNSSIPGSGTPGSGVPGANAPGAGRTVSGIPGGTGTGTGTAAARSAAAAARSGMPGMGGISPRGKDSDSEQEHQTPDYLVNMHNGEELTGLGEINRHTPGSPVIGE